jgi:hypothetical protein
MIKETIYQTTFNGEKIEYLQQQSKYGRSPIGITVDGKVWGSPQGDRFFEALLNDIRELKEKNSKLQRIIEEGITFEDLYNPDDEINPQSR